MKALSIRQPWAWLIVQGVKPVENRSWKTHFRGRLLVHASLRIDRDDYACAQEILSACDTRLTLPSIESLSRGGVVGSVEVFDCVDDLDSEWFFGPYGWRLRAAQALPFVRCPGRLGLFDCQM